MHSVIIRFQFKKFQNVKRFKIIGQIYKYLRILLIHLFDPSIFGFTIDRLESLLQAGFKVYSVLGS